MDAFYASVEQRDDPALRGRPVVVGGSPEERGVVAAASYEARKHGVRSAMPMSRALRLCPQAALIAPHFTKYRKASEIIRGVFLDYTDIIEPVSLDEAYLDVSEKVERFDQAVVIGREIKSKIKERTQLTASVGIGPNKYIAKIASDYNKPNGFCTVTPEQVLEFITPLPVRRIPGVGAKTEERLHILQIDTIGRLRSFSLPVLQRAFGAKHGERLHQLARGIDESPVSVERIRKSLSQEHTFPQDIASVERMRNILLGLADDVSNLLIKKGLKGRTVGIKVRFGDFHIATRSQTLEHRTCDSGIIGKIAVELLDRIDLSNKKVRLLGVRMAGFEAPPPKKEIPAKPDLQLRLWE